MPEFALIEDFFSHLGETRDDVLLGVGDDAAIVSPQSNRQLLVSTDTLIEGVHFPKQTNAYDVGWKSLAVNLSDMAAMGAIPCWVTLALSIPAEDIPWIREFCRGFHELARLHKVQLIGGDLCRGPLSITVQILGQQEEGKILKRNAACVGDKIYVTGMLGQAAVGLKSLSEKLPLDHSELEPLLLALNRPQPRVNEAIRLAPWINAAIDISDGLVSDLGHILKASGVGAVVDVATIPVSRAYTWCQQGESVVDLAMTGGDDYELCLTVSKSNEDEFNAQAEKLGLRCTAIGEIIEGETLKLIRHDVPYILHKKSWDHFRSENHG